MRIKQLHLKFPANVKSEEVRKAIYKVFAEYGRRGGRGAKVTDTRRESARQLMNEINERRRLMKDLGLKSAGSEHIYFNENDPMIKELIALKAKVNNLEMLTKKKIPQRMKKKVLSEHR